MRTIKALEVLMSGEKRAEISSSVCAQREAETGAKGCDISPFRHLAPNSRYLWSHDSKVCNYDRRQISELMPCICSSQLLFQLDLKPDLLTKITQSRVGM